MHSIYPKEVLKQMASDERDERDGRIERTAVAVLAAMEALGPLTTNSDLFASRLRHAFDVAEAYEIERERRREAKRGGR